MRNPTAHIQTLQNLCVIARADGALAPEEETLIHEMGKGMGVDESVIADMLARIDELDFSIPDSEADRVMELRLVVLMMFSDGRENSQELAACQELARRMEIGEDYLVEIMTFYREKQAEQGRHLGIFQNLFLVAVANGHIGEDEQRLLLEVAHNLGLSQKDIDYLLENHHQLDFVIPEEEEERLFSLKNLVYMMIVDGQIDEEEYQLCLEFAQRIGYGHQEIAEIIEEYQQLQRQREAEQTEIQHANLDLYLDVCQDFSNLPMSPTALAEWLLRVIRSGNCVPIPDLDDSQQLTFYRFLWLMYVRCTTIAPESAILLPAYLDRAQEQQDFKHLRDFLMQNEQTFGGSAIELPNLGLRDIQLQINQQLQHWHRHLIPDVVRHLI